METQELAERLRDFLLPLALDEDIDYIVDAYEHLNIGSMRRIAAAIATEAGVPVPEELV